MHLMTELDLPYGPWTRLVSAQWGDYPVAIYSNADRVLLLVLFEKRGEDISGILVMLKKVFIADGDIGKAISAQKREVTVIQKFSGAAATESAYVLVGSTPTYAGYTQDALVTAMGKQFNELRGVSKLVQDIGESYHVRLRDIRDGNEEEIQGLLGDPFILFSLVHPEAAKREDALKAAIEAIVGSDLRDALVKLPLETMRSTVIHGGTSASRLHAMHVLIESGLINSIPAVVFDASNAFGGLSQPNKDTRGFTKHQMTAMPLGFPYKEYVLGKGLYVDLSFVNAQEFTNAFGLAGTDVGLTIERAWTERMEKHVLSDIAEAVTSLRESRELSQYVLAKTVRVLKVIDKQHPATFGKNAASDLLVPWHEGIGRVFHINLQLARPAVAQLLMISLVRALPVPKGHRTRVTLAFEPQAQELSTDLFKQIQELQKVSAAFILHAGHALDLAIIDSPSLKMEMIGSEVVASTANGKPVRFVLRPSFTSCTEAEPTTQSSTVVPQAPIASGIQATPALKPAKA